MNPYDPPQTIDSQTESNKPARLRLWPLLLMNAAFLISAGLIVLLPSLRHWLIVSSLICLSFGGWTLAKTLQDPSSRR